MKIEYAPPQKKHVPEPLEINILRIHMHARTHCTITAFLTEIHTRTCACDRLRKEQTFKGRRY